LHGTLRTWSYSEADPSIVQSMTSASARGLTLPPESMVILKTR
jgi:hypothetical protein